MHTVWQLPLAVAGLVVLLLQLLGEGAAAATGAAAANQHVQSFRRSKVRSVPATCTPPRVRRAFRRLLRRGTLAAAPPGRASPAMFDQGGVNERALMMKRVVCIELYKGVNSFRPCPTNRRSTQVVWAAFSAAQRRRRAAP
jgi:hypothetical protein